MLDGHHDDGEIPPVTDLAILRVLLPRDCGHCGGLLLLDADDPGHSKCSECCRSTYRPVDTLALEPDRERCIHAPRHLEPKARGRDVSVPQGHINPLLRRFA